MRISERIEGTIENWRAKWGEILRSWMASWLSWGMELFFDILSKSFSPKLRPLVEALEATGKIPPELQPLLDEIKTPTGEVGAMLSQSAGSALVGGALGKIIDAIFLPISYVINKRTQNVMLTLDQYLAAWLRGKVTPEYLKEAMYATGLPDSDHDILKDLSQIRLDPMSVITAWRRDKTKYEKLFRDLKDQGWDNDRIEALKFITLYYPSPAELINWQAKEVFEPEMIRQYGLDAELGEVEREAFYKAGMSDEQIVNHWRAHWTHASWGQITEMLHRDQITDEEVWRWFRVVEIPPYYREKLIATSWDIPNRIEIRMMARYLDLPKEQVVDLLKKAGLAEEYRSDAADFMIIMGLTGYWSKMLSKGWMSPEQIKADIDARKLNPVTAERIYKSLVKSEKPEQIELDRLATATEIMKGVKKEYISWTQGVEMLGDLGYDKETAEFKLTVYGAVIEGSPETYPEFKQMTQAYRKAMGLSAVEVPEEVIKASKEVAEAKEALRQVGTKERTDITEAKAQTDLTNAEYRYRQLLIKWEAEKKKLSS